MNYLKGEKKQRAQLFMHQAAKIAQQALCLRAQCGTIIVQGNEVIGIGYNAPPLDDTKHQRCFDDLHEFGKPKYDKTCCVHAEWRALLDALKKNPEKIKGAELFFTRVDRNGNIKKSGKPFCTVCSRLALDAGIAYFVLWHDEGIVVYPTSDYNTLSYHYRE